MTGETKNRKMSTQGGFVETILAIFVVLLIMKFMGVTISEVIYWFKSFFASVLQ